MLVPADKALLDEKLCLHDFPKVLLGILVTNTSVLNKVSEYQWYRKQMFPTSRKHTYIISTPLNPTFI